MSMKRLVAIAVLVVVIRIVEYKLHFRGTEVKSAFFSLRAFRPVKPVKLAKLCVGGDSLCLDLWSVGEHPHPALGKEHPPIGQADMLGVDRLHCEVEGRCSVAVLYNQIPGTGFGGDVEVKGGWLRVECWNGYPCVKF